VPPFLLESLGHMLLLRQRAGAALTGLLLRHGAMVVLGALHAAATELGSRRRFLSGLAPCCETQTPGRQQRGVLGSTSASSSTGTVS
jgi:hypothetical protein